MCFASQTPGLCSALISLRLPYPVCTRFICRVFVSFASQTPGLYSVFDFPSAPLPALHTFLFLMFVCFASQTPGCVVLLISLRLPCPVCTRFTCQVSCASPRYRPFCAVLLSLVPLPFTQVCSFYQCVSPLKQCYSIFLGIFCSLMRLLAFTVISLVFLLRSPSFAFPRCFHSDPCPSILYAFFVLFFFYALYCFSRIFSLATGFLFNGFFAALPIASRALLACVYNHLLPLKQWLSVGLFSPLQVYASFLFRLVVFKVFCFASFAAFFSHCLVLFPGHPFFIFTCFFHVRVSSPEFVYLICL